jgi:hypothetical protein
MTFVAAATAHAPPLVSVLMPTCGQAHFIRRALDSLQAQSLTEWEAIIVDDGSLDDTAGVVRPWLADPRVRYFALPANSGLGHALNIAMDHATATRIAYLPSDDVIYRNHLAQLVDCLDGGDHVLAVSGMRHHYNRSTPARLDSAGLQLVQCMHRRVPVRWTERAELESDDLERLFWHRLRAAGSVGETGLVSCEWVDHPHQRHKLMQEPEGGINPFRQYYGVTEPLRFHSTKGNAIDEATQYSVPRARADTSPAADGLDILLVGELAYNADRVLALEERGHTLSGLWMREPYWYNAVGPMPFGHVRELPADHWREAIARHPPDLIYAQLNWQAVPFAHEVMRATPGVPFVWHFKEGPFICIKKGSWPRLLDLYELADGRMFSSVEMRDWFDTVIPELSRSRPSHVLDGDLPRGVWFDGPASAKLSDSDGEIHTVVPGRPIGLHPATVAELAAQGIHLHFYGDFTQGQWREWIAKAGQLAPRHLHLHRNVDQADWVATFSRYDAGWLHAFASSNGGELRRANWDDLNLPARMATLAAAGLPMIQRDNTGAIVATQTLARELDIGIFYDTIDALGAQLRDQARLEQLRRNVWQQRHRFSFDYHVDDLLAFFRKVIGSAGEGARRRA